MEQIGDMKFVDFEEILERDLGKIGTPKRDEFERKVNETVKKEFSVITEFFAVEKSRLLGFNLVFIPCKSFANENSLQEFFH